MAEPLHIILVPHTHWDREWYLTFQQFRFRLVQAVDKLLSTLDHDEAFTHFLLDGQTIVLDDYLEVRPEHEERLRRHIRNGRISVGPWYVQPDEFLVSGESLIRNLQVGLRRAAEFGTPMYVGYLPDDFGHIAQMPQILRGVGIDSVVFWRGVGSEARKSEFLWSAPDGSHVLVIHLADPIGYSNARQMPLDPQEFVTRVELLTTNLLSKATTDTLLFMNGSDHLEPQAGLPEAMKAANKLLAHIDPSRKQLLSTLTTLTQVEAESIPSYDAIDVRIGTLPEYIEYVRQHVPEQEFQMLRGDMRSSQYAHLLPSVLSTRMWIKQQNSANEHLLEHMVEPLTAWAWTLGADYPKGLVREAWRHLLQNHPHDSICGCSIDQVHRENAVRFAQSQQISELLVNQAVDQIVSHVDTQAPVPTTQIGHDPVPILVFNPGPGPRAERVQVDVQLPGSLHNAVVVDAQEHQVPYRIVNRWRQEIGAMPFAREMLAASVAFAGITSAEQFIQMTKGLIATAVGRSEESFVISRVHVEDHTESPIHHVPHPPQPGIVYIEIMIAPSGRVVVNEQELVNTTEHILSLLTHEDIHMFEISLVDQARETIELLAADLPSNGYKTFWLYPRGLHSDRSDAETQYTLTASEKHIENEFYALEVDTQDGTLTVIDKANGTIFSGLNRFMDGGDVGDLYNYSPPEHDTFVAEPVEPPKIELVNTGPIQATLRVSGRWSLPVSCTTNRAERNARTVICSISSDVTLIAGSRRIHIHTSVDNRARDHRLRVLFPVPYQVEQVAVEGAFEVRMRPIAHPRPENVAEWIEEPVNVLPQKRFVDVGDGETGLAVLNKGLPECEILQGDSANGVESGKLAVAVTLLRCVEWLSRGDLKTRRGHAGPAEHTPEAQCQGHSEFDYALVPHSGTWETDDSLVLREAQAFNIPTITRVMSLESQERQKPVLPAQASIVEVEPAGVVVSAIKRSNDGNGLIVRVYNPTHDAVNAHLHLHNTFKQAYRTNLLEERQGECVASDTNSIAVTLQIGEIATFLFVGA